MSNQNGHFLNLDEENLVEKYDDFENTDVNITEESNLILGSESSPTLITGTNNSTIIGSSGGANINRSVSDNTSIGENVGINLYTGTDGIISWDHTMMSLENSVFDSHREFVSDAYVSTQGPNNNKRVREGDEDDINSNKKPKLN